MMIKKLVLVALISIGLSGFSFNVKAQEMTPEERKAIESVIHDYLLSHPEIITEAIGILQAKQQAKQQELMAKAIAENQGPLYNDGYSVVGGNPNGDVTIVEFFDYRCPYCVQAHKDMKKLLQQDSNIRVIYKQFPVKDRPNEQPISLTSARMAQAISKQSIYLFNSFHDKLMSYNTKITMENLGQAAREVGVDMALMQTDLQDPAIIDGIRNNFELAQAIGVTGTPTYVIGDQVMVGALGLERMKAAVAQQRKAKN